MELKWTDLLVSVNDDGFEVDSIILTGDGHVEEGLLRPQPMEGLGDGRREVAPRQMILLLIPTRVTHPQFDVSSSTNFNRMTLISGQHVIK